jgi:hypothetical protein
MVRRDAFTSPSFAVRRPGDMAAAAAAAAAVAAAVRSVAVAPTVGMPAYVCTHVLRNSGDRPREAERKKGTCKEFSR